MHQKVFEPQLLAAGAQKLYRWRINRDIAENFIPRLVRKGYLKRKGPARDGIYLVDFQKPVEPANLADISKIVERIIDEFEEFPPRVTDLLNCHRTREELTALPCVLGRLR
jgi:hypothetical protein